VPPHFEKGSATHEHTHRLKKATIWWDRSYNSVFALKCSYSFVHMYGLSGGFQHVIIIINLMQRFPNFFWSRTICGPCLFIAYHLENTLFQDNSICPISQYHSIKSLANQTWHKCGMDNIAVRNYNGQFLKLGKSTKMQEFINRTQ